MHPTFCYGSLSAAASISHPTYALSAHNTWEYPFTKLWPPAQNSYPQLSSGAVVGKGQPHPIGRERTSMRFQACHLHAVTSCLSQRQGKKEAGAGRRGEEVVCSG